jgi:chorismate-pyruvate lyase
MTSVADSELLFPLSYFCCKSGAPLPPCEIIEGHEVPEPYRRLLVHNGDMTSRLENFHSAPMKLRVLHREIERDAYRREVLLCAQDTGLPVEYGAIEINLDAFASNLRERILEARLPLGGLLNRAGVRYHSEPRAFLKLAPDSVMDAHFELDGAHKLYGRCNVLQGVDGRVLARIVEVLRP